MAEDDEARATLAEAAASGGSFPAGSGWGGSGAAWPPAPAAALGGGEAAPPKPHPRTALVSTSLDDARRVRAFLATGVVSGAGPGPFRE